jgi:MFS family permease
VIHFFSENPLLMVIIALAIFSWKLTGLLGIAFGLVMLALAIYFGFFTAMNRLGTIPQVLIIMFIIVSFVLAVIGLFGFLTGHGSWKWFTIFIATFPIIAASNPLLNLVEYHSPRKPKRQRKKSRKRIGKTFILRFLSNFLPSHPNNNPRQGLTKPD